MSIFSNLDSLPIHSGRPFRLTHCEMSKNFNQIRSHTHGGSIFSVGQAYNLRICRDFKLPRLGGNFSRLWQLVMLRLWSEWILQMLEGNWIKSSQWSIVSSERDGKMWDKSMTDSSRLLFILHRIRDIFRKFFKGTVDSDNLPMDTFSSQRLLKLAKLEKMEKLPMVALLVL